MSQTEGLEFVPSRGLASQPLSENDLSVSLKISQNICCALVFLKSDHVSSFNMDFEDCFFVNVCCDGF